MQNASQVQSRGVFLQGCIRRDRLRSIIHPSLPSLSSYRYVCFRMTTSIFQGVSPEALACSSMYLSIYLSRSVKYLWQRLLLSRAGWLLHRSTTISHTEHAMLSKPFYTILAASLAVSTVAGRKSNCTDNSDVDKVLIGGGPSGTISVADFDGSSFDIVANNTIAGTSASWLLFKEPNLLYAVDENGNTTRLFSVRWSRGCIVLEWRGEMYTS